MYDSKHIMGLNKPNLVYVVVDERKKSSNLFGLNADVTL